MESIPSGWYLVKMNFDVLVGQPATPIQQHTQWRLLLAPDVHTAMARAEEIGRIEGQIAMPPLQGLIQWQYHGASEIFPLDQLLDGAEIFSHCIPTPNHA
ncbi:MAG TPA: DUF4288 domain-containing protein [Phnomibacter sp.]|nr:DUF4288 domain-containing protein [Phnomibacter sp.]